MGDLVLKKDKDFRKNHAFALIHVYKDDGVKVSPECEVKPSDEKPIQGHYKIIVHHLQGGGNGGWDSYDEPLALTNRKNLYNKVHECALKYAKKYAKDIKANFVDFTNIRSFQKNELSRIVDSY
jgi:hypothetical protein